MEGLRDKVIISTASEEKSDRISKAFSLKGASVYNFPLIKISPANDNKNEIKKAFAELKNTDLIVFTGGNAVKYFFFWYKKFDININLKNKKIAAIGKATTEILKKYDTKTDFSHNCKDSEEFAQILLKETADKKMNVFIPSGNIAQDNVYNILKTHHNCIKPVVYNTQSIIKPDKTLIALINENCYDFIIFLSPSAVNTFVKITEKNINIKNLRCISVGNTTKKALLKHKINPVFMPSIPNIDIMATELNTFLKTNKIYKTV